MDEKWIVEVEGMTKKFGDFTAVDSISFKVKKGEIFGFLGANGAGKTTAIKILCGLSKPTSGKVIVDRLNVYNQAEKIKEKIGYMSQKFSLYDDLSIEENIRLFGGIYGLSNNQIKEKSELLINKLGLHEVRKELLKSLPLGWKQKLAFSVAIIHDPSIVFLDEPTGGVDPITRRQFWEMIYEASSKGVTIFVTTHYMDEAEYCSRISMMVDGHIAAMGKPTDLKKELGVSNMDEFFVKLARSK